VLKREMEPSRKATSALNPVSRSQSVQFVAIKLEFKWIHSTVSTYKELVAMLLFFNPVGYVL